jgi:hypothetical protein
MVAIIVTDPPFSTFRAIPKNLRGISSAPTSIPPDITRPVPDPLRLNDLPIRVSGVQDNGCAAVYSSVRPWFRFVSVMGDTAYFQESIDKANEIWVGNIFVADDKQLKLTVVVDGQGPGKPSFIDGHNPTDKEITTTVLSPAGTPVFGGTTGQVKIPAGDTVRLMIEGKILK